MRPIKKIKIIFSAFQRFEERARLSSSTDDHTTTIVLLLLVVVVVVATRRGSILQVHVGQQLLDVALKVERHGGRAVAFERQAVAGAQELREIPFD